MGLKKSDLADLPESANDWYAHLFYISRKKCLIFTHAKTLFTFIAMNVPRENIRMINEVFRMGLERTLLLEGFTSQDIDKILASVSDIVFAKTINRAVIGSMNDLIFQYLSMIEYNLPNGSMDMSRIMKEMNRIPMSYIDNYAIEKFKEHYSITSASIPPNYQ